MWTRKPDPPSGPGYVLAALAIWMAVLAGLFGPRPPAPDPVHAPRACVCPSARLLPG